MGNKIERDPITGQYTTGHQWNGIRELRTPVPTWWMLVWIASIAFAVVYAVLLPSIPLGDQTTAGTTGYTARLALEEQLETVRTAREAQGAVWPKWNWPTSPPILNSQRSPLMAVARPSV
jgi:cytochrome c oxidase cbb3-type subunit 3